MSNYFAVNMKALGEQTLLCNNLELSSLKLKHAMFRQILNSLWFYYHPMTFTGLVFVFSLHTIG